MKLLKTTGSKSILFSAVFFLASLLFSVFPSSGREQPVLEKISLQLQWKHQFEFAGFYAAKEKGFFREAGLDVELREYEPGTDIIDSVLSGGATFGIAYSSVISARMSGKPVTLLANYFKRSPLVIVSKPEIYFPDELKGKTLMGETYEVESANFLQMFHQFDVELSDFKVVPHTFTVDKFVDGDVDAMTVFLTNEIFYLRQRQVPFNIIDPNIYAIPFYDVNLFTSETYAQARPTVVRAFRDACNMGWEYALGHPEEIIDLILEKYNTQNKTREHLLFEANATRRVMLPDIYPVGSVSPGQIRKMEEVFAVEGIADTIVEPEEFIFELKDTGRLSLTDEEKRFIGDHPTVRVIRSFHQPPFSIIRQGAPTGYLYELLVEAMKLAGMQVEYVGGFQTHESMIEALQDDSADILPNVNSSRILPEPVRRTVPVITTPNVLVAKISTPSITQFSELSGKKVAVVKGYAQDRYLDTFPAIIKVPVLNNEEGFKAVRDDAADYFLNNHANAEYVLQKSFAHDMYIAANLPYADFPPIQLSFGVNGKHSALPVIIDKALAELPLETLTRLQNRWFEPGRPGKEKSAVELVFTPDEQSYRNAHPVLSVAFDIDWPPVEFAGKDGNMLGISADYLSKISGLLGIDFKPGAPRPWQKMLAAVKKGELAILPAISPTEQRRQWLDFTDSYLSFPMVIVTRKHVPYIGGFNDLGGKKVAVVSGYASQDLLSANHPELTLLPADNVSEGLLAVSTGKAYAFVGSLATISHIMEREGITGLKVSGKTPYNYTIAMAVRKGETELLSLLNKALNALTKEEKKEIYNKWIQFHIEQKVDYSLIWKITAVSTIILFVILFWNRRLQRMANKLTQANIRLTGEIRKRTRVEAALRLSEKSIRKYADTQSVLLREVNHRVKNNLVAIISMLHQEEDRASEEGMEEYQSRLQEIVSRVSGLLTVHSMLSASQWEPLPVMQLCEAVIRETIKGIQADQSVQLELSPADILIASDQAHYLTIVINELATNTVKYALHDRSTARIRVSADRKDDEISLIFHDDGPGFPEHILTGRIPKSSIGIHLVNGIVAKSLRGKIEVRNDNGAFVRISFPSTSAKPIAEATSHG